MTVYFSSLYLTSAFPVPLHSAAAINSSLNKSQSPLHATVLGAVGLLSLPLSIAGVLELSSALV